MSHSTIFIVVFIYWVEVDASLVSILVPLGSATDCLVWWYAGEEVGDGVAHSVSTGG